MIFEKFFKSFSFYLLTWTTFTQLSCVFLFRSRENAVSIYGKHGPKRNRATDTEKCFDKDDTRTNSSHISLSTGCRSEKGERSRQKGEPVLYTDLLYCKIGLPKESFDKNFNEH